MSNATNSVGTVLKKGVNTVAEIKEISGIDVKGETIDVTTLASTGGYREFLLGFKDPGEVQLSGFFYPGDTNGQASMYADLISGASDSYTIEFPSSLGESWTFTGYVMGFKTQATVEGPIAFDATLKVSGAPTLGTTASTGWSAFILRNAADDADATNDAYVPTVAAGEYQYSVSFDTNTSVRPKVTAASHTIQFYVDDVYVENLTSGVSGNAVAFGSAGTVKKFTFKCFEAGKTPKVYDVMVHRTS